MFGGGLSDVHLIKSVSATVQKQSYLHLIILFTSSLIVIASVWNPPGCTWLFIVFLLDSFVFQERHASSKVKMTRGGEEMQLSPSWQIIIFPTPSPDYCITCGRCSSPTQKQTTKAFLSVEFHPLLVANISFHSCEISGSFVINNNKWKLEWKWKKNQRK